MKQNMGKPNLLYTDNDEDMFRPIINIPLEVFGKKMLYTPVNFNGVHTVFFVDDIENIDVFLLGKEVFSNKKFSFNQSNLEFVEVLDTNNIILRSFSAEAGELNSNVTGACASVVAGVLTGNTAKTVNVCQRENSLCVEWAGIKDPLTKVKDENIFIIKSEHFSQ